MRWPLGLIPLFVRLCIANSIPYEVLAQESYDIMFENHTVSYSEAFNQLQQDGLQYDNSSFWQPGATYKPFRVTSNETHICRFPIKDVNKNLSSELSTAEASEILARGLNRLDSLYDEVPWIQNNYFLNMFFYGRNILQAPAAEAFYIYEQIDRFPYFSKPETLRKNYYMLGRWPNGSTLEENIQNSQLMPLLGSATSDPNTPSGPLTHNSKFFIQQVWKNGSICNLNGIPRQTTVRVSAKRALITVLLWQYYNYKNVDGSNDMRLVCVTITHAVWL